MKLRLLTFDLDDTLWPVGPVIMRAEHQMRTWLDARIPELNARFDREAMGALREDLLRERPELIHDLSAMRRMLIREAARQCGHPDPDEIAEGAFTVFMDGRHEIEYFEGALDTLAHLARHYTLGALSNGNASVERLGLDRYFAFHLNSEGVGRKKPDPLMFERALNLAGVTPEQAAHIGDHPDDDVRGANAVGLATVWVQREGTPWTGDDAPTWTIRELTELRRLFPG